MRPIISARWPHKPLLVMQVLTSDYHASASLGRPTSLDGIGSCTGTNEVSKCAPGIVNRARFSNLRHFELTPVTLHASTTQHCHPLPNAYVVQRADLRCGSGRGRCAGSPGLTSYIITHRCPVTVCYAVAVPARTAFKSEVAKLAATQLEGIHCLWAPCNVPGPSPNLP
jgi:hypothetical protein